MSIQQRYVFKVNRKQPCEAAAPEFLNNVHVSSDWNPYYTLSILALHMVSVLKKQFLFRMKGLCYISKY